MSEYRNFVSAKSQLGNACGFKPNFSHSRAHDFQSHLVEWAVNQGRAAIFADCGLGKTLMQMTWAQNVINHTNKPVLIVAPLMVSAQTVEEAAIFDFDAVRSRAGENVEQARIVTANYERLHMFDPAQFAGVVCDESSILKNFDGARKSQITEFMKKVPYRLLCSATPSPNDYIELGTSSEALGQLGYMDMLGMFFKNDEDSLHPMSMGSQFRFKTHAQKDFWRWICSWARAVRKPSDLGFSDKGYELPSLFENEHVVDSERRGDMLFALPSANLQEERDERRSTIKARCEMAASLAISKPSSVMWCHLNDEANSLVQMVPGSKQVAGSDCDDKKEELFTAFKYGQLSHLVTKPKIAAYGLNWQHVSHMTFFADHSFEQYYQSVRRMWRFGQLLPVTVDVVTSQSLAGVTRNLKRKSVAAEAMFALMVAQMNDSMSINRYQEHNSKMEKPSWL